MQAVDDTDTRDVPFDAPVDAGLIKQIWISGSPKSSEVEDLTGHVTDTKGWIDGDILSFAEQGMHVFIRQPDVPQARRVSVAGLRQRRVADGTSIARAPGSPAHAA